MTYDLHRSKLPNSDSSRFASYRNIMRSAFAALFVPLVIVNANFAQTTVQPEANHPTTSSQQPQVEPNQLLLKAVEIAVWGPSLSCQVVQHTNMFGQQQVGVGQYRHSGKGEGQLELGMRFSTGRSQLTFEQLSDGRLLWSRANDGHPPRRVYLDRVRQALGPLPPSPQSSPTINLYLAIGGQPGLLRSLYHRYRWYKIFAGEVDRQPVWELIGTLRQDPPIPGAHAPYDVHSFGAPASELMPTEARIVLVRDGGGELDLRPLRIEYFRRMLDDKGQFKGNLSVSRIEYSDIHVNGHFEVSTTTFQDLSANPVDETPDYMIPGQVAASEPPTNR